MTDERDPKLSRRYRELGSEEPSRELDQTILAAAHRAADRPHAPLVAPAGRHRWYFALGAAAVLVLAVAVTVQVERQQPDPEALPASPGPVRTDRAEGFFYRQEQEKDSKRAEMERQVERPRPFSDAAPPARDARRAPAREAPPAVSPPAEVKPPPSVEAQSQTGPAPSAKPDSADSPGLRQQSTAIDAPPGASLPAQSQPAPPGATESRQESAPPEADTRARAATRSAEAQRAPVPQAAAPSADVLASAAQASPDRLLERIAELRRQGRHDEADKVLAEFRQRYPDYRISEEMRQKVERRK